MFKGSMVAIVTPFKENGSVDYETLEKLIEFQIENNTDVIVPVGTTGESATLSHQEHIDVIKFVVEKVNKRVPVLAGAGSNSTAEAIMLGKEAKEAGADGLLVITPYYNKPTQNGLYEHFKTVAREVRMPIVMYNVPGRTGINMLPETVARIANDVPEIVGIKEATANMGQATEILNLVDKDDFCLISGDDMTAFTLVMIGGVGVISVVANIVPADVSRMIHYALEGNVEEARKLHRKLYPLSKAMFVETNPVPVKTALGLLDLIPNPKPRLPLVPMTEQNLEKLKNAMKNYGLKV